MHILRLLIGLVLACSLSFTNAWAMILDGERLSYQDGIIALSTDCDHMQAVDRTVLAPCQAMLLSLESQGPLGEGHFVDENGTVLEAYELVDRNLNTGLFDDPAVIRELARQSLSGAIAALSEMSAGEFQNLPPDFDNHFIECMLGYVQAGGNLSFANSALNAFERNYRGPTGSGFTQADYDGLRTRLSFIDKMNKAQTPQDYAEILAFVEQHGYRTPAEEQEAYLNGEALPGFAFEATETQVLLASLEAAQRGDLAPENLAYLKTNTARLSRLKYAEGQYGYTISNEESAEAGAELLLSTGLIRAPRLPRGGRIGAAGAAAAAKITNISNKVNSRLNGRPITRNADEVADAGRAADEAAVSPRNEGSDAARRVNDETTSGPDVAIENRPVTEFVDGVTVTDRRTGQTYTGTADLRNTLTRIEEGGSHPDLPPISSLDYCESLLACNFEGADVCVRAGSLRSRSFR